MTKLNHRILNMDVFQWQRFIKRRFKNNHVTSAWIFNHCVKNADISVHFSQILSLKGHEHEIFAPFSHKSVVPSPLIYPLKYFLYLLWFHDGIHQTNVWCPWKQKTPRMKRGCSLICAFQTRKFEWHAAVSKSPC